jgi:phytoene dehydrogenase-like protein
MGHLLAPVPPVFRLEFRHADAHSGGPLKRMGSLGRKMALHTWKTTRTRRHFIRTVLLGATATGVPGCTPTPGRAPRERARRPVTPLRGEAFDTCHAVRDGETWPSAPVSTRHEVVIVGGGPSGLVAAQRLGDRDLLLLEKEETLGGNCTLDEWQGVTMSTGAAFYTESETELVAFFAEIGARGRRIVGEDSLVVDGQPVTDFFRSGADRLPFPAQARDDFKRSRDDMLKLLETRSPEQLDGVSFATLLVPYHPLLAKFWDRFGPSNWGATTAETSGLVGAEAYTWAGGSDDPRWSFPGGMAGAARALADWLRPRLGDRLRTGAAVYRIEREPRDAAVVVRYVKDGRPFAAQARVVIVALPKFYASHVVPGLPAPQLEAMKAFRYQPFPVFNVCLERPGPEPAYDNWFLDAPFTDFVPADWVVHAGQGPRDRKTVLTVYHPLPRERRKELLVDTMVLEMADGVADALERHFPGTVDSIAEIRVFRRGHPMFVSAPGLHALAERASRPFGPILFANTDSAAGISSFDGALTAATRAAEAALMLLAT